MVDVVMSGPLTEPGFLPKVRILGIDFGPGVDKTVIDARRPARMRRECPGYDPYNSATTHRCSSRYTWDKEPVKVNRTWNLWERLYDSY